MNIKKAAPYIFFIAVSEAAGALAGFLTRDGIAAFENVAKSALTPPNAVFPIVWSVLYLLMGIGAARVYTSQSDGKKQALALFAAQLVVNFFWNPIFFNLRAYALAFAWLVLLVVLVLLMTKEFFLVDKTAGLLQIPYIIWSIFALYLSFAVWMMNG